MLRQVTSDMQDNIQSGCNGHKFTDDVAKWCILNETVGQMKLSLSKLHIEPHPRADGPRKLPGRLPASIPLLPVLYRDLCMSLDDADFSLQLPERCSQGAPAGKIRDTHSPLVYYPWPIHRPGPIFRPVTPCHSPKKARIQTQHGSSLVNFSSIRPVICRDRVCQLKLRHGICRPAWQRPYFRSRCPRHFMLKKDHYCTKTIVWRTYTKFGLNWAQFGEDIWSGRKMGPGRCMGQG